MLLSEHIQNEVLTITSEHPSYKNYFDIKFQANIYSSDQSDEKQEQELIEFKEKYHDEFRKFSSGTV